ncbi:MAG: hypothetical protein AAF098_13405 [Pseudomonadota bacterium]
MKPKAPGRGRPPKEETADAFLHIRVRKEDKARWVAEARKEGMKLSQWVTQKLG